MELHLRIAGVLLIVLGLAHAGFPRYFAWKKELFGLSLINRQMVYVHTFFIALTVFLMGVLCLTSSAEIAETPLGRKVSLGLAVFWIARLFVQFFGYSPGAARKAIRNGGTYRHVDSLGLLQRGVRCDCLDLERRLNLLPGQRIHSKQYQED